MIKAYIRKPYLMRLAMIALFCIGISLWFFKDGIFTYPMLRAWALEYEKCEAEKVPPEEWKEIARKNGWPPNRVPEKAKTEFEIMEQYFYGGLLLLPGVLYLFFLAQHWGRWIEATETGLKTSKKIAFNYDAIQQLDKSKWKKKGIAKISYESEGNTKTMVLDDWKYDTDATVAILREVESHISEEMITGGTFEPPQQAEEQIDEEEQDSREPQETDEPAHRET